MAGQTISGKFLGGLWEQNQCITHLLPTTSQHLFYTTVSQLLSHKESTYLLWYYIFPSQNMLVVVTTWERHWKGAIWVGLTESQAISILILFGRWGECWVEEVLKGCWEDVEWKKCWMDIDMSLLIILIYHNTCTRRPRVRIMLVRTILDVRTKFWGSKKSQMRVCYSKMHGCKNIL